MEGETAQLGLQWASAAEDRCSGWREQHVEGTARRGPEASHEGREQFLVAVC